MLNLIQTEWGRFDLAFDGAADAQADVEPTVATLVYAALFTDAAAPASRVPDRFERRGWWADAQAGSGLWYVRRQALDSAARREALAMVRTALTTRAPALTEVAVQETSVDDPAGNVSRVFLEVTGLHNGRKFLVKAPL
jgi:phage gp46-like protein